MIQDTINSIKATLYDRVTSPLFAAFTISWILWNHRLVTVMFSPLPYEDKFRYIDNVLYGDPWRWWGLLIVYPLLSTAAFLFLYPYPAKWVFEFWRNRQNELKAIQQKIDDETPVTKDEARKLRRDLEDLRVEHDNQMSVKNSQVERHKREVVESRGAQEEQNKLLVEVNGKLAAAESQIQHLSESSASVIRPGDVSFLPIIDKKYRLYFNPTHGKSKSKVIGFLDNGVIADGKNDNENSWRIASGRLELMNASGTPHSRFGFDQRFGVFVMVEDDSLPAIKNQYMVPEL